MSHGAAAASLAPAPGPRHPAHTVGDTGEEEYEIFFFSHSNIYLTNIYLKIRLRVVYSTITAKLVALAVSGVKWSLRLRDFFLLYFLVF